ncbi:hypothetical protein [Fretibacter rubidus]|uniref:hypothetical protein n=1 Tax=Fretibacter rubidus TaxID=570162 RepID=UPI00352B44BD
MFGRILIFTLLTLGALTMTPPPSFAQSQDYDVRPEASRLMGEALTSSFTGMTHTGAYNFNPRGEPGNRYTEWHGDDGAIIYREGDLMAKGRWAARNDMICYDYNNNILGSGCFRVYKLGSCHYFYSSSLLARDDELSTDYWTARSVHKGQRATCEDMIS